MLEGEKGGRFGEPQPEPDDELEDEFRRYQRAVKMMARQQLDVSEDSPFNRHQPLEWAQLKLEQDERARQLRDETDEIKKQLELVKSRMTELNMAREESKLSPENDERHNEGEQKQCSNSQPSQENDVAAGTYRLGSSAGASTTNATTTITTTYNGRTATSRRNPQVADQQATSVDNQFHRSYGSSLNLAGDSHASSQRDLHQTSQQPLSSKPATDELTKLRPLTGKTDCPNCACDKRRRSVCDTCCQLQQIVVQHPSVASSSTETRDDTTPATNLRQPSFLIGKQQQQQQQQSQQQADNNFTQQDSTNATNNAIKTTSASNYNYINYDERPIRQAKPATNGDQSDGHFGDGPSKLRARVEVVDKVVVPNKLYTIGKSLDDKRTKLAQAIEDLQLMMDRVKKRGDRLDQERKVAQLYREQWKFGPAIGGGGGRGKPGGVPHSTDCATKAKAETKARLPQYQSRLDPNLARDTNSLMGFQHVEAQMKLREYGGGGGGGNLSNRLGQRSQPLSQPPQPKPRHSKMSKTSVQGTPVNFRRSTTTTKNMHHSRSKSLESLPARPVRPVMASSVGASRQTALKSTRVVNHSEPPGPDDTNFQQGKSSSELNLASARSLAAGEDEGEGDAIEEEIEEEIVSVGGDRDNLEDGVDHESGNTRPATGYGTRRDGSKGNERQVGDRSGKDVVDEDDGNQNGDSGGHDDGSEPQLNPKVTADADRTRSGEGDRVKKMTWVPVFGETEIKTVQRRQPTRKLVVLNDCDGERPRGQARAGTQRQQQQTPQPQTTRPPGSILRQQPRAGASTSGYTQSTALKRRSYSAVTQAAGRGAVKQRHHGRDLVMNEAAKKLQFAEDLLDSEQRDSRTRNQVLIKANSRLRGCSQVRSGHSGQSNAVNGAIVRHRQQPTSRMPRVVAPSAADQCRQRADNQDPASTEVAQDLIVGANREISRLEELISEQQRLLLRLANTQASLAAGSRIAAPSSNGPDCDCPSHGRHSSPCACSPLRQTQSKSHMTHTPAATVAGHGGGGGGGGSSSRQLIVHLRERLNKTKMRLARTLEEERAKHHRLEQKVDSSLRKQSDLANENELLKRSLSKCIDTCLRDIASTFESLSDTLTDSMVSLANYETSDTNSEPTPDGMQATTSATTASHASQLTNAAQLISDNCHLKRMRAHIETIERQRRGIFEELSNEKIKSQQLELELRQSKQELDELVAAKRKLEAQLISTTGGSGSGFGPTGGGVSQQGEGFGEEQLPQQSISGDGNRTRDSSPTVSSRAVQETPTQAPSLPNYQAQAQPRPSTSKQAMCDMVPSSSDYESNQTDRSAADELSSNTLNSIDIYRQYIQSMTPDLDAIRRERRLILDEFDNIKKMLSEMDN